MNQEEREKLANAKMALNVAYNAIIKGCRDCSRLYLDTYAWGCSVHIHTLDVLHEENMRLRSLLAAEVTA